MSKVELKSGTVLKITPIDGNSNKVSVITGTESPFRKYFLDGIEVTAEDDSSIFNCDVEISGSISLKKIYSLAGSGTITSATVGSGYSVFDLKPSTLNTITMQIPLVDTINPGKILHIKNTGRGTVILDGVGPTTIDAAPTKTSTNQYDFCTIIDSGVEPPGWLIIANGGSGSSTGFQT